MSSQPNSPLSTSSRRPNYPNSMTRDEIFVLFRGLKSKDDVIQALTKHQEVIKRIPLHAPSVTIEQARKDFRRERVLLNDVPFIPDQVDVSRSNGFAKSLTMLIDRIKNRGHINCTETVNVADLIMQRACRTSAGADSFFTVQRLLCVDGTFVTQKTSDHDPPIKIDVFISSNCEDLFHQSDAVSPWLPGGGGLLHYQTRPFSEVISRSESGRGLHIVEGGVGNSVRPFSMTSVSSAVATALIEPLSEGELVSPSNCSSPQRARLEILASSTLDYSEESRIESSMSSLNSPVVNHDTSCAEASVFSVEITRDTPDHLAVSTSHSERSTGNLDASNLSTSSFEPSPTYHRTISSEKLSRYSQSSVDSPTTGPMNTSSSAKTSGQGHNKWLRNSIVSFDLRSTPASSGAMSFLGRRIPRLSMSAVSGSNTASSSYDPALVSRELCCRVEMRNTFAIYDVEVMDLLSGDPTQDPPAWIDLEAVIIDESNFKTGENYRRLQFNILNPKLYRRASKASSLLSMNPFSPVGRKEKDHSGGSLLSSTSSANEEKGKALPEVVSVYSGTLASTKSDEVFVNSSDISPIERDGRGRFSPPILPTTSSSPGKGEDFAGTPTLSTPNRALGINSDHSSSNLYYT